MCSAHFLCQGCLIIYDEAPLHVCNNEVLATWTLAAAGHSLRRWGEGGRWPARAIMSVAISNVKTTVARACAGQMIVKHSVILPSFHLLLCVGLLPRADELRNGSGTAPCRYAPEILTGPFSCLHANIYWWVEKLHSECSEASSSHCKGPALWLTLGH